MAPKNKGPYSYPEDRIEQNEDQQRKQTIRKQGLANMNVYELARAQYPEKMNGLEDWHTCIHCRARFQELNNLGRWQCRYHPGRLGPNRHAWKCCGASVDPRENQFESNQVKGCRLSDHCAETDGWTEWDTQRLPEAIFDLFNAHKDAVVQSMQHDDVFKSWVEVRRAQPLENDGNDEEE